MKNPFNPGFAVMPPLLVGRDEMISEFEEALEDPGSPARSSLITGPRGSGKTVLLHRFKELARQRKWQVLQVSTRPGILNELVSSRLPELIYEMDKPKRRMKQLGGNFMGTGLSVSWGEEGSPAPAPSFRSLLFRAADLAEKQGGGLLLTLDEVQRDAIEDLRVITQEVQHAFGENKRLVFAAAGLPSAVSDLLNDNVLTFLRRSERFVLNQPVARDEVGRALQVPARSSGKPFKPEALEIAVEGTRGFPYLIQSIGRYSWRSARGGEMIGVEAAERGIAEARRKIGENVHHDSLKHLSETDRSFLVAMALDDGPSKMADLIERLSSDQHRLQPQYANTYRQRLMDQELVFSPRRGYLDFTLPYLREYLREHTVADYLDF